MGDTAAARFRMNFDRLLYEKKTNQTAVARQAGFSPSWGTSTKTAAPSFDAVDRIAKALNADISEFFKRPTGDQSRHTPVAPSERHTSTGGLDAAIDSVTHDQLKELAHDLAAAVRALARSAAEATNDLQAQSEGTRPHKAAKPSHRQ